MMGSLFNSYYAIKLWFRAQWELQQGQGFLWWSVWAGFGVALYFSLPFEPSIWAGVLAVIVFGLAARAFEHGAVRGVLVAMLFVSLGFAAGQVRTLSVDAPSISEEIKFIKISGVIHSVEAMDTAGKQFRFILQDLNLEGVDEPPGRVRLTLRSKEDLSGVYKSGLRISGLASLNMSSGPVLPGGYDFRQHLFFERIGGVGFFYGAPEIVPDHDPGNVYYEGWIENWREIIAERVLQVFPDRRGAIVVALLTGLRGSMTDADVDAFAASGLAHMLAISGMNVGLFSGVVFFALRLLLAAVPGLALHWPIKKIAAILAFIAAFFYMSLAGATIPTQRSVLMIGVVFLAVLMDRTALSMRLVSFAALVFLLLMPESLLSVSFQLSFAAVVALIAVYDGLREWFLDFFRQAGLMQKILFYVGGVVLTSGVATLATAPFTLYHFQTLPVYSVVANVLATPLMSFVIMPMTVLVLAAMPFGLEAWPLYVMVQGADGVLRIANMVAAWDDAVLRMAVLPVSAFVVSVIGGLWMILVRGHLKWCGVAGFLLAALLTWQSVPPDIYVSEKHGLWAYRAEDGVFYVSSRSKDKFARENWERSLGLTEGVSVNWKKDTALRCDEAACRMELRGRKVSFVDEGEVIPEECAWADVLIARRNVYGIECAAETVIDYSDTKDEGVHAVYLSDSVVGVRVQSVADALGARPWVRSGSDR